MEEKVKFSGWIMVGICWLVGLFVVAPWTLGMSILLPRIVKSLHLSANDAGMGLSTGAIVTAVGYLFAAWLIHHIGIRWTMTSGLGVLAAALVMVLKLHGQTALPPAKNFLPGPLPCYPRPMSID